MNLFLNANKNKISFAFTSEVFFALFAFKNLLNAKSAKRRMLLFTLVLDYVL
jgi:hypothetical protein